MPRQPFPPDDVALASYADGAFLDAASALSGDRPLSKADRKSIVAAGIGNCLELFDLTVFGFFAVTIGAQFFPSQDSLTSLLGSFATFALGFLMRPAGALVLSSLGNRRGFLGSFQQVGFGLGILLGTAFSLGVNTLIDEPTRASWGWRLPFLFGALVTPIAFYIRRNVDESPAFEAIAAIGKRAVSPVRTAFAQHGGAILAVIGIGTAGTAAGYLSSQFINAFAVRSLHLPAAQVSSWLTIASVAPRSGRRRSRRPTSCEIPVSVPNSDSLSCYQPKFVL